MRDLIDTVLAALTIAQEAGGEPRSGKLGVAFVLAVNRPAGGKSISDTIFQPWHFSCWNTDSPTRMNIDQISDALFAECWNCVNAAVHGLEPDPTKGANHYLNEELTKRIRPNGDLPSWFDHAKVTARIGLHTFLKL